MLCILNHHVYLKYLNSYLKPKKKRRGPNEWILLTTQTHRRKARGDAKKVKCGRKVKEEESLKVEEAMSHCT